MKNWFPFCILPLLTLFIAPEGNGQSFSADTTDPLNGLRLRPIGPANKSGRIADIAIHPLHENTWYVAVGSGGIWKTTNAGTTWIPIFDDQAVYSMGCICIDPNHPLTLWAGTGENVGGRHVGFGNGIYCSKDGGENWSHKGLKTSRHIAKIIVHPTNSNILWVAAQGSLWNKGGQRGVYKSTDGGDSWKKVLGGNAWTGATDLLIDPRNPDRLYAATWQRHRTVAAYISGGSGSGIYRTEDGGDTWQQLKTGLPESRMGKIGLALSPRQPDMVYAAIELERRSGGIYCSTNRGQSWEKRSSTVSGATGPHYYQELYASPHHKNRLYLADVHMQVSSDGGYSWSLLPDQNKHSDNHALAFKKDAPDYLLAGTDGGLYESFDAAQNWRFIDNLPITQFYKVAVDDALPFYHIYGGTQDNNTLAGPSRTPNRHGIANANWEVILHADGHQPATEAGNPHLVYANWQGGNLCRIDRITGEITLIKPQAAPHEAPERFNWDAPILVSPHAPTRLYFASQRVWRSYDRGDSWMAISGDLTRNQDRMQLPLMGKRQGWDEAWDLLAMSNYNTITALSESPIQEGLLYAGTDDGLIQVSENGGKTWKKIEVSSLPAAPKRAFVNDIKADLFDANTVYVALDNHKTDDLRPYLYKSTNKGKSWRSIKGNLSAPNLIWRLVQDHKRPQLLFAGTEFGLYYTNNGGKKWIPLKAGMPTIAVRDLAIQRRENDLVVATFGRGIYILDDYSALRETGSKRMDLEAALMTPRDAWWYIEKSPLGFRQHDRGASHYLAPNPPFGATFTYHLKSSYQSKQAQRQIAEQKLRDKNYEIPFPGWNVVEAERRASNPQIWLVIKDRDGKVIRRLNGPTQKGFHRVSWDLRYPSRQPIPLQPNSPTTQSDYTQKQAPQGLLVPPGSYSVSLVKEAEGKLSPLTPALPFQVKPLYDGALKGAQPRDVALFWQKTEQLMGTLTAIEKSLQLAFRKTRAMQKASIQSAAPPGSLDTQLHQLLQTLYTIEETISGNKSRQTIGQIGPLPLSERLDEIRNGVIYSTYGPTTTHKQAAEWIKNQLHALHSQLHEIHHRQLPQIENRLRAIGAPLLEGSLPEIR